MYTVIAKFRYGLEQHSKIKFGVKQSVKWLGSIPYLHRLKRERHLMENRSSHQRCSVKKGVLRNFAKFTGKHLCQSLFFNEVPGGACNFIKKEALAQVFSCEFCEISKNAFLTEHVWATASWKIKLENKLIGTGYNKVL